VSGDSKPFAPPAAAAAFKTRDERKPSIESVPGLGEIASLLAEALRHSEGTTSAARRARPAWDRRRALVCASPAYREAIAESLATHQYEVFVAENLAEALGRMRGERMDVVILDANFDPLEQGVAFITREVRLLRPSERRRVFFVYVLSEVRTMDLHAAFLHNVNLVVNPSDIEQLPEALDASISHYNELYRPLTTALNIAPI
jgi:CheY-like chemotaxis protein